MSMMVIMMVGLVVVVMVVMMMVVTRLHSFHVALLGSKHQFMFMMIMMMFTLTPKILGSPTLC